jgi:hypothetical protein
MSLTGEPFNAKYLAEDCNKTIDQTWQDAQKQMADASSRHYPPALNPGLDATIRIVHGAEVIADNQESDQAMCAQFEQWVAQHGHAPSPH